MKKRRGFGQKWTMSPSAIASGTMMSSAAEWPSHMDWPPTDLLHMHIRLNYPSRKGQLYSNRRKAQEKKLCPSSR